MQWHHEDCRIEEQRHDIASLMRVEIYFRGWLLGMSRWYKLQTQVRGRCVYIANNFVICLPSFVKREINQNLTLNNFYPMDVMIYTPKIERRSKSSKFPNHETLNSSSTHKIINKSSLTSVLFLLKYFNLKLMWRSMSTPPDIILKIIFLCDFENASNW